MKLNFFRSETFFVCFLSLLLMVVSIYPTVYESFQGKNLPQDRILVWGEHNYTYDYNLYIAKMHQGQEGRWTVLNKVTTEPQKGAFLQMFYLLTGKIGGFLGFSSQMTYLFLRIVLGVFWLIAGYFFIGQFLNHSLERKAAFLFFAFSGSLPRIVKTVEGWQVWSFFDWWQEFDVLKRTTYLPHFLLGHILTVVMVVLLLKGIQVVKGKARVKGSLVLAASLLGFVAGMTHPSSLIVVYGIWGGLSLFYLGRLLIQKYTLNNIVKYLSYSLFFFVFSFLALICIKSATSTLAWQGIAKFAQTRWKWSIRDFCLGMGASLFLGIGGLILTIKETKFYPLIAWVLTVPLGMIFLRISNLFDVSYFFQVAVHLPLAILTVVFLKRIAKKAFIPVVVFVFLFSLPATIVSFKGQIDFINARAVATQPLVPYPSQVMYPLQDFWKAIKWLEKNTCDEEVVFSEETAGNYIVAHAGNFVYLGHNSETVDFDKKKMIVDQFFSQRLTSAEALVLLKENGVGYVFYGPQEKEKGVFDEAKYPFLKPVFESKQVTLFGVK